jgi:hypothetical protein
MDETDLQLLLILRRVTVKWETNKACFLPQVGKVTLKINGDESLSDESVLKSNGDKVLNGNFLQN